MTTPSTTTYRRREIILIPFQFSDRPVAKLRPALVVSSSSYQAARQEVVIAAVTSRIRNPLLVGDHEIKGWRKAGLPKPSVVTAILRTVKRSMIVRNVGQLTAAEMAAVDQNLQEVLDLHA